MTTAGIYLSCAMFDAAIFDMDGVITQTAKVHAAAWKAVFDDFLQEYAEHSGEPFEAFDLDRDYRRYVNGKPRYDGVRDFLSSRAIELPYGKTDDAPDKRTIFGLGNRKNRRFREMLAEHGTEPYESTVIFIRKLKSAGIATAVISASRNCREVLRAAGVEDLFDVRVDGIDTQELGIRGKPEPDIFLAAAHKLGVSPERTVVVEDALAGVEAGRRGAFGLVIGVDRVGQAAQLARYADVVVQDLKEVKLEEGSALTMTDELPSALDNMKEIADYLQDKEAIVFIDYDGTLTPIVERPELAELSEEIRQALRVLAAKCTVAVVSGRDLADVRDLVAIDEILYAGCHGFDISGPEGHLDYPQGLDYLPDLDLAEQSLRKLLQEVPGCQVERKRFAIAVHFRRVADAQVPKVEAAVDEVLSGHDSLLKTEGKMIFELRPDIEWGKGKALNWILQKLELDRQDVLPFYIGDDLTDEDAFRELQNRGITILVRDKRRPTAAHYALESPKEVRFFLHRLAELLEDPTDE